MLPLKLFNRISLSLRFSFFLGYPNSLDSLAVQLNYNVTDDGARRVLIRGNKNKIETLNHL